MIKSCLSCLFTKQLFLVFITVLLSSCSYSIPLYSLPSSANESVLGRFRQPTRKLCALTNLYVVARYWGINKDIEQIEQELGNVPKKGYSLRQLRDWAKDNGLEGYVIAGSFEELWNQVKKKRPIIVVLKKWTGNHSVVVKSITYNDDIYVMDPKSGRNVTINNSTFMRQWGALNSPMLIIAPVKT